MTPIEALKKIKELFAEQSVNVQKFSEYVLSDGSKVMIDELKMGGKVTVLDSTGQEVPAPVGTLTLADGSIVTVAEGGMIAEISTPAEENNEPEMDMKVSEKVAKMEQELQMLKSSFDAEVQRFSSKEKEIESREKMVNKSIHDLAEIVAELFKTPSSEPTNVPAEKFSLVEDKKQNKIDRMLKAFHSINNN